MMLSDDILNKLYDVAKKSFDEKEIPVSAAIFDQDNNMLCVLGNNRQQNNNVLGHAEINCILEAERVINDWRLDGYYMVVTLEPCDMCDAIIKECRLDKVYYFLSSKNAKNGNVFLNKEQIEGYGEFKEKLDKLLTSFFDNMR